MVTLLLAIGLCFALSRVSALEILVRHGGKWPAEPQGFNEWFAGFLSLAFLIAEFVFSVLLGLRLF